MKKRLLLIPSIVAITTIPFMGMVSCNKHKDYVKVTFESNGILALQTIQGEKDQDYVGKITLNDQFKGIYDIPQSNCYYEVTIGNLKVEDFDVDQIGDQNNYYARITIPKDNFKAGTDITITAKQCPHYLCFEAVDEKTSIGYIVDESHGTFERDIKVCSDISVAQPIWQDWDGTEKTLELGSKLYVWNKKNTLNHGYGQRLKFRTNNNDKKLRVTGNIMSMINFDTITEHCFSCLFEGQPIYDMVPILPATSLATCCYLYLFLECHLLINMPELPATSLAVSCYECMFDDCTALKNLSELPAMQMQEDCYNDMFCGCENITKAPNLPATELAEGCYINMFYDCIRLTEPPYLPARQLKSYCYDNMFDCCYSLEITLDPNDHKIFTCPVYSAEIIKPVYDMFSDCILGEGVPEDGTPQPNVTYYWK